MKNNNVINRVKSSKHIISFLMLQKICKDSISFIILTKPKKDTQLLGKNGDTEIPQIIAGQGLYYDNLTLSHGIKYEKSGEQLFLHLPVGNFLLFSTFIETLSFHLCSIHNTKDFSHLIIRHDRYRDIDQSIRLAKIKEICRNCKDDIDIVNNEMKNLLEVRNQIAHNFSPEYIIYQEKCYCVDEPELLEMLKDAIKKVINLLAKYYRKEEKRFYKKNETEIRAQFHY